MDFGDFWLQTSKSRKISSDNLKELKKSDLENNAALIKIFDFFNTKKASGGEEEVLDAEELNSLFKTVSAKASKGNSSIFEISEAEEFLNETASKDGQTLKNTGIKISDLFDFLKKIVNPDKNSLILETPFAMFGQEHLTDEQAQESVIMTLIEDASDARTLLMHQDNGVVSDGYEKLKTYAFNHKEQADYIKKITDVSVYIPQLTISSIAAKFLIGEFNEAGEKSLTNVEESLALEEICADNLYLAKEGELSKREYFVQNREHLKTMMLRRLYRKNQKTGIDFIDKNRGNMSREEFSKLMESYIERQINQIQDLDSLKRLQHTLLLTTDRGVEEILNGYKENALKDLATEKSFELKDNPQIPKEYDTEEPITFEEVFKIERNQTYSKMSVENYLKQKQMTDFKTASYNKYLSFKTPAEEFLNDYKNNSTTTIDTYGISHTRQPNPDEQMKKVVEMFSSYYYNIYNENAAKDELEKLITENNLPIMVIKDSEGNITLDMSQIKSDIEKNKILNKLVTIEAEGLKHELESMLGGNIEEKLAELSAKTQQAYGDAYGWDFSNELAQAMNDDNKTFIQKYTGDASSTGMALTVIGGVLCFTPAAAVGAGLVTVGNTLAIGGMVAESGLGFTEALSRSNLDSEEIGELSKTLVMNAGGFVIGMKAGQTGMKAFNKLIDKKLVEVFKTEMVKGNRIEALKQVFTQPEYLKSFMQAAGVKLSADFVISYAGDLAMMGVLGTNDDWMSLLQSNLIGIMAGMGGDIKDIANVGIKGDRYRTLKQKEQQGKLTPNENVELANLRNIPDITNAENMKPSLSEIDKYTRDNKINQANLSPQRFNVVNNKQAQAQVGAYLNYLLDNLPDDLTEAPVDGVAKYDDFLLPDGTVISRNHAGDSGQITIDETTGKHIVKDRTDVVLFWIKDTEGIEHVLPCLTPENVSKARKIIAYMATQESIPRENIPQAQITKSGKNKSRVEELAERIKNEQLDSSKKSEDINSAKTIHEFISKICQYVDDENISSILKNLSEDDANILKKIFQDEFQKDVDMHFIAFDECIKDFKSLINSIQQICKEDRSNFSDELNFLNKIMTEPSSQREDLIGSDAFDSRTPASVNEYRIIKRLYKLRETLNTNLLNVDNIIYLAQQFKDITDVELLVKYIEDKKANSIYEVLTLGDLSNINIYDVDPKIMDVEIKRKKESYLEVIGNDAELVKLLNDVEKNNKLALWGGLCDKSFIEYKKEKTVRNRANLINHLKNINPEYIKSDIQTNMTLVKDETFRNMINEKLNDAEQHKKNTNEYKYELGKVRDLVDIYNNLVGNYTTIDNNSYWKEYLDFITQKNPKLAQKIRQNPSIGNVSQSRFKQFKDFVKNKLNISVDKLKSNDLETMVKEFEESQRVDKLVEYCKNNNNEISNYLYDEVYLKRANITAEAKERINAIKNKYNIKIFLPAEYNNSNMSKFLDSIENELNQWNKASNGQAKYSSVYDFTKAKQDYVDTTSAYGMGASAGFANTMNHSISLNLDESDARFLTALRHEMTHINDLKILNNFNDENFVVRKNGKIIASKCKYYDDFVRIGIPKNHIAYAYNDPAEFIAVASEGNLHKCTPEFKKVLIEFGMPEWMFDMENVN